MSQNSGKPQGEMQNGSDRISDEKRDRSRYEGFEGMNYEQRRPLYTPRQTSNGEEEDSVNGKGRNN